VKVPSIRTFPSNASFPSNSDPLPRSALRSPPDAVYSRVSLCCMVFTSSAGSSLRPGVGGSAGRHTGVSGELPLSGRDLSFDRLNVIRDITSSTRESLERSRGSPLDERHTATAVPMSPPTPAAPKMTGRPPGTISAAGIARKRPARKPRPAPKRKPSAQTLPALAPTAPDCGPGLSEQASGRAFFRRRARLREDYGTVSGAQVVAAGSSGVSPTRSWTTSADGSPAAPIVTAMPPPLTDRRRLAGSHPPTASGPTYRVAGRGEVGPTGSRAQRGASHQGRSNQER
jgi:hypothetical protein